MAAKIDDFSCNIIQKGSSVTRQASAAEGKVPHRCPRSKSDEPSWRSVPVNMYRSL